MRASKPKDRNKKESLKKTGERQDQRIKEALRKVIHRETSSIDPKDHYHLLAICHRMPTDYQPYGEAEGGGRGRDCSSGCRWYIELAGNLGMDWGCCANPNSYRCGLLTFEHQGCYAFEKGEDDSHSLKGVLAQGQQKAKL